MREQNDKQNPKKQKKFNFFDILLLVLLLLIIAGAIVYLLRDRSENPVETVAIEYTVVVKDQPDYMHIVIEEGDTVIDSQKLKTSGTVAAVSIEPATYDVYAESTQSMVHGDMQDTNNVYITIRANVEQNGAGYLLNGQHLAVGGVAYVRTPRFVAKGYVVSVEKVTEGK